MVNKIDLQDLILCLYRRLVIHYKCCKLQMIPEITTLQYIIPLIADTVHGYCGNYVANRMIKAISKSSCVLKNRIICQ